MFKLIASTLLVTLICAPKFCLAFCSMNHSDAIDQIVSQSNYYIVGEAVSKHCFEFDNLIFTNYKIRVSQSSENFEKGQLVSILKKGGSINGLSEYHSGISSIPLNEKFVFLIKDSSVSVQIDNQAEPYYQLSSNNNALLSFSEIEKDDKKVELISNKWSAFSATIAEINHTESQSKVLNSNAEIVNFYPTEIVAGNFSVLTINGSGFGSFENLANIQFRNANSIDDSQFIITPQNHIQSWTDTQIRVMVPGTNVETGDVGAGTGPIKITTSEGVVITSNIDLYISGQKIVSDLSTVDLNSISIIGNFGFYVNNELVAMGALPAIERAINTWNCKTGVKYEILGYTDIDYNANDNFNVIALDNASLVNGLASSKTTIDKCSEDAFLIDADILLNSNYNWNTTISETANNFYDLESTILHELGHVHQLGHVLNEGDLMYPFFPTATEKREIGTDEIKVAKSILQSSVLPNSCGTYPIKTIENNYCEDEKPAAVFTLDKQVICLGESISFEDLSTQSPNEWIWFLPGSEFEQVVVSNPQVTYNTVGTFDVSLIVTNQYGSDMIECIDCITVVDDCCTIPTAIETSNITETGATITWPSNLGTDGYVVKIKPINETTWSTFNANNSFGILSGLMPCTNYEIQIQPNCAEANFSDSFYLQTEGCQNCAYPPTSFESGITKNSIFLNWDIIPNAEHYIFEYKIQGQNEWFVYESKIPILILFGLPTCTSIEYKIKSVCLEGFVSDESEIKNVQTLCERKSAHIVEDDFNVYPNPANDFLKISNHNNLNIKHIYVFNLFGQQVLNFAQLPQQIDVSQLQKGQYYLQIETESSSSVIPFIKS